ncbi:MOSC domain-containing protein [Kitasatospora sp. NPDC059571]|uniref:MOSC domain-containing protein n=1 Tax=Kitasatospora sp. NPDC059571 TaxID=3346871 RepID=UPI003679514D
MSGAMTVLGLHRYPLKSALGEPLAAARITARGIAGDRVRALLDTGTGRIASAKNPRLWRALLTASATTAEDGFVRVLGPDGRELDEGGFTALLGRPVRLVDTPPPGAELERAVPEEVLAHGPDREVPVTIGGLGRAAPPGTFVDFAPLHLITTATLAAVGGAAQAARYRPNLVVDTPGAAAFTENAWVGRELRIGATVRLAVIAASPRCAVPTLAHGSLPPDPAALRTLARRNRVVPLPGLGPLPCAGVYATVVTGGTVAAGAPVSLG